MFAKWESELKAKLSIELAAEKLSKQQIDHVLDAAFGSSSSSAATATSAPPSDLPLLVRKNIADNEPKWTKNHERIQKALGMPVDVTLAPDFDWHGLVTSLAGPAGYATKPGDIWTRIAGNLATNIEKFAKNEMTREAVVAAWTTGQIRLFFRPNEPKEGKWRGAGRG